MKSQSHTIRSGYTPGLIGAVTELHGRYYSDLVGFGVQFEAKVANEMAVFIQQIDDPKNGIWWVKANDRITACIAIDGSPVPDAPAVLHWFIVAPELQGSGVGKQLMATAMQFCDENGYAQVELATFQGLEAARYLYEQAGFKLVNETPGTSWGTTVVEQTFRRTRSS